MLEAGDAFPKLVATALATSEEACCTVPVPCNGCLPSPRSGLAASLVCASGDLCGNGRTTTLPPGTGRVSNAGDRPRWADTKRTASSLLPEEILILPPSSCGGGVCAATGGCEPCCGCCWWWCCCCCCAPLRFLSNEVPSLRDQTPLNTRLPGKHPCGCFSWSPSVAGECDLGRESSVPGGELAADATLGAAGVPAVSERASILTDPALLLGSGANFCCG